LGVCCLGRSRCVGLAATLTPVTPTHPAHRGLSRLMLVPLCVPVCVSGSEEQSHVSVGSAGGYCMSMTVLRLAAASGVNCGFWDACLVQHVSQQMYDLSFSALGLAAATPVCSLLLPSSSVCCHVAAHALVCHTCSALWLRVWRPWGIIWSRARMLCASALLVSSLAIMFSRARMRVHQLCSVAAWHLVP
jgi:hypothetical protein